MSLSRFSLAGKVAVVTGSGRGLGRAIAQGYAEASAAVVTSARTAGEAESAAAEIRARGGRAIAVSTDVADPAACAALIEKAMSSNASLVAFPDLLTYNISKGGVDQMVRTLAVEWGGRNIRVNAFNPGYLEHAMTRSEEYDSDPKVEETIQRMTPLRRRGRLEEVVGVAIFLASDASSFVTGTVLPVDGGWCAM
jgi:NAD(P)-dependent dehydrogenase (short-subunit alcohol dehydrogenase family)